MAKFIKVIERATGTEFRAEAIEGGFQVYSLTGEAYKKLKDSTFKRNFKLLGASEEAQPEPEAKAEEPKAEEKKAAKPTQESKKPQPEVKAEDVVKTELSPEKREKMIEKIKKMLALAENNPSQEEALSAALQAHKLMAKYNIHEDDVTLQEINEDEITSVFSTQTHDSHLMGWRKQLASVVSKAFRCKCYLNKGDVVFRGYKDDAQLALDVYLMLYTIGHKLAKKQETKERTATGSAKGIYTSFSIGFVYGVEEALNQQCTALLVVTPKAVEEDWTQFSANFRKGRASGGVSNAAAFHSGKREGKEAVASRSIETKSRK